MPLPDGRAVLNPTLCNERSSPIIPASLTNPTLFLSKPFLSWESLTTLHAWHNITATEATTRQATRAPQHAVGRLPLIASVLGILYSLRNHGHLVLIVHI